MTEYRAVEKVIADGDRIEIPDEAINVETEWTTVESTGIGGSSQRQVRVRYLVPTDG